MKLELPKHSFAVIVTLHLTDDTVKVEGYTNFNIDRAETDEDYADTVRLGHVLVRGLGNLITEDPELVMHAGIDEITRED